MTVNLGVLFDEKGCEKIKGSKKKVLKKYMCKIVLNMDHRM